MFTKIVSSFTIVLLMSGCNPFEIFSFDKKDADPSCAAEISSADIGEGEEFTCDDPIEEPSNADIKTNIDQPKSQNPTDGLKTEGLKDESDKDKKNEEEKVQEENSEDKDKDKDVGDSKDEKQEDNDTKIIVTTTSNEEVKKDATPKEKSETFSCTIAEDKSRAICNSMEIGLAEGRDWQECKLIVYPERNPVAYELSCIFHIGGNQGEQSDKEVETVATPDENIISQQCVEDAVREGKRPHAIILSRIGRFLATDSLKFTEFNDGTAKLEGEVVKDNDLGQKFLVGITFTTKNDNAPDGSPKKELSRSMYADRGGPIDPSTWYYYETTEGFLLGLDKLAGGQIRISRKGPAYQARYQVVSATLQPKVTS